MLINWRHSLPFCDFYDKKVEKCIIRVYNRNIVSTERTDAA